MDTFRVLLFFLTRTYWLIAISNSETIRFEIHGSQGHLQTPNYPSSYPLNFTNIWTIRGPKGSRLQLNFTDFDVEANKKCLYDYVLVGNAIGQTALKFCGKTIPPGFISRDSNAFIKFASDLTTTKRGFKAKWKAVWAKGDAASTHSVPSIECKAKHVITITDPPCPEPSTESAKSTSCICPPRSLIIERVATSSSILLTSPSLPVISGLLPVKGIANVDDANNTVADKCAQGIDKHLTDSNTSSNRKLVIILGALTAVFFFIDILLIALWCLRYKRNSNDMAHNCRTELPPMELKIIDGKVISSPRRPGPRVKFSIDESAPHRTQNSRPQSNDGNGNHRGDQGIDLLKSSRYVDQNECSKLVVTSQSE